MVKMKKEEEEEDNPWTGYEAGQFLFVLYGFNKRRNYTPSSSRSITTTS